MLRGVRWELRRGTGDEEGTSELVLLGNRSATGGYVLLASETRPEAKRAS